MSTVTDITPPHEPMSLAREMVERAPKAKAAICVLVNENGSLWIDSCGHEEAYIVWGLNKILHRIMVEKDDQE